MILIEEYIKIMKHRSFTNQEIDLLNSYTEFVKDRILKLIKK